MNEKSVLLQLIEEGYRIYVASQPAIFKELTVSGELKPHIQFVNCLAAANRDWYKNNITELNQRVFGPKSMPTAAWIDHHFGIVAGVTLGLLNKTGPISMMRFVRRFEEDTIHEWTMLVDPEYTGKGFAKATLALGCALSQNKKRISLTTQLDNPAVALYLHLANEGNPLELLAIGFHHTHPNSILVVADIPRDPNSILKGYQMPPRSKGILFKGQSPLRGRQYLIAANDSSAIQAISRDLGQGAKYHIVGWYSNHKDLEVEEPLTMLEKI